LHSPFAPMLRLPCNGLCAKPPTGAVRQRGSRASRHHMRDLPGDAVCIKQVVGTNAAGEAPDRIHDLNGGRE
jgi:hypothetical protein